MTKETENGMQSEAPAGSRVEGVQTIAKAAESGAPAGSQQRETQPAGRICRLPAAWSRLIGVAAVMVFLVGGTLLTRDSFHAKMSQPVMASDAGGAVLQSARVEESAANLTEADSDGAEFVTTDAEQLDEAAYKEAALDSVLPGTEEVADGEVAFEETEEAAFAGSSADADAGVPAAGLMMSSLPAAAPEAEAISGTAALTETEANEAAEADTYEIAEAVTEESFDAAMSEEQPAEESETAAENELAETAAEPNQEAQATAYQGDCPPGTAEQIEPDPHPVLTFLRDMGFFIRWIAPWALVLAVGVFAGWLAGRRR